MAEARNPYPIVSWYEPVRRWPTHVGSLPWLIAINVVISASSLATNVMLANVLGASTYGELVYALAIGAIGVALVMCGLDRSWIRELVAVANSDRLVSVVSAGVILRAVMLIPFASIVAGAVFWLPEPHALSWPAVLVALAATIQALSLKDLYDVWGASKRHSIYQLIERLVYFAAVWLVLITSGEQTSVLMIGALMLASALSGIGLQYYWAGRRLPFRFGEDTASLAWKFLKNGRWLWLASLASLCWPALSRIVLKHLSGNEDVGAFGAAWNLVVITLLFCAQIGRIFTPRLARLCLDDASLDERMRVLRVYVTLCVLPAAACGIPALVAPRRLLNLLFEAEYAIAAGQLRIIGIYVIVVGFGYAFGQYLICTRRDRAYAAGVIGSAVLSMLLYIPFISAWSGAGAAWVLLLSHGTACLYYAAVGLTDLRRALKAQPKPNNLREFPGTTAA